MSVLRVLIAGGGTGGHVFPAIAVAEQLQADRPAAEVLFVGSDQGLERELVPAHGFPIELLRVGKLKGARWWTRVRTLATLGPAVARAARITRRFSPSVMVGVGGYASAPVVLAAALLRRPTVLLEQNAVPGATNRAVARFARKVVVSFEEATAYFPRRKVLCLGNPLRPALVATLGRAARAEPAERPSRLLVLGGSQGAHRLNELVTAAAPRLARAVSELTITHQTGEADRCWVADRYRQHGVNARAVAFIDDIGAAYESADLVVARSGATTVAELTVAGLPAVLVPYPYAADDHQAKNAAALVAAGGALMMREQQLDAARLEELIGALLANPARLARMSEAMRRCGRPEAAAAVVHLLQQVAATPPQENG